MAIQLEAGVTIDGENNLVIFPVGDSLVLKFTLEEWMTFASLVADANLVFEANTSINNYQCEACGTVSTLLEYEEPDEEDFN